CYKSDLGNVNSNKLHTFVLISSTTSRSLSSYTQALCLTNYSLLKCKRMGTDRVTRCHAPTVYRC
ncbi:MAG: hypothetical protein ACN6PI_24975, partial [Sphingobacterium siyangense]